MNKKILGSVAGMVAVFGLIGGGTFAAWTADNSVDGNTVQAGYLELGLTNTSGATPQPFNTGPVAPGIPNVDQTWLVANNSSTPSILSTLHFTLDDLTTSGQAGDALSEQAIARVHTRKPDGDGSCGPSSGDAGWGSHGAKSISDWVNEDFIQIGPSAYQQIANNQSMCVRLRLEFPTTMDNDSQNGQLSFNSLFELRQVL
jgi:predicted ribosomally synthesized peptide with SipW-like signal peptide